MAIFAKKAALDQANQYLAVRDTLAVPSATL
jgi:hypothetical protein